MQKCLWFDFFISFSENNRTFEGPGGKPDWNETEMNVLPSCHFYVCWCRVRKGTGSQSVVVCVAKYPEGERWQQGSANAVGNAHSYWLSGVLCTSGLAVLRVYVYRAWGTTLACSYSSLNICRNQWKESCTSETSTGGSRIIRANNTKWNNSNYEWRKQGRDFFSLSLQFAVNLDSSTFE